MAAATGGQREKATRDEVSLNAIQRETIRKENRSQRLVTEFSVNPHHKRLLHTDDYAERISHCDWSVTKSGVYVGDWKPVRDLRRGSVHAVTGKPMARHDNQNEAADESFLTLIHHAALEPTQKYTEPQTTSQEIGWITRPLISIDWTDQRLQHHRQKTEITAYMETAWKLKEQSVNLQ